HPIPHRPKRTQRRPSPRQTARPPHRRRAEPPQRPRASPPRSTLTRNPSRNRSRGRRRSPHRRQSRRRRGSTMGSKRGRAHRAAFAVPLAVLLFASNAAFAQQPSASDRETARALMAEGRERRDAGDLAAALKSFQTADSIMHVPTTGLEVARTLDKMG